MLKEQVSYMNFNSFLIRFIVFYNYFVLYYLIFVNGFYTFLLILSMKGVFIHGKTSEFLPYYEMLSSIFVPPVSIIVPCHNEESTIVENIYSLLSLEYSQFEIVVVNDGSTDNTLQVLIDGLDLKKIDRPYKSSIPTADVRGIYISGKFENLVVIDKENGGKADALNSGVNICKYPLFTAIDADSVLEKNALLKVIVPFIKDSEKVVASGGIVRVVNGSKVDRGFIEKVKLSQNSLAIFQTVEYLRAFLFGRIGFSMLNGLLIVSGAFGVFKKDIVIKVGGYTSNTIGEDMELIIKIHEYLRERKEDYRVVFVPDPVCWTQAPEDIKSLSSQRIRWHRGLMDSLFRHKKMFLNPKYGIVGMFSIPYYWIVELFGPIIEVTGYVVVILSIIFGLINWKFAIIFFLFAVVYGVFLSIGAVLLEEYNFKKYEDVKDYLKLILYSILENFGYRQMVTWWRFRAFFGYKKGKKTWGNIKRKEFTE